MLRPDDLRAAAAWSARRFGGLPAAAWHEPAPEWTRRRTLDHVVDALALYAAYVGARARGRLTPPRDGDPDAAPARLLEELAGTSELLAGRLDAMADGERAFHPSGLADRTGWIGMACTEVLVHTWDATRAADAAMDALAGAVVDRVLPWAPRAPAGAGCCRPPGGPRSAPPLRRTPTGGGRAPRRRSGTGRPRRRTAPPQW